MSNKVGLPQILELIRNLGGAVNTKASIDALNSAINGLQSQIDAVESGGAGIVFTKPLVVFGSDTNNKTILTKITNDYINDASLSEGKIVGLVSDLTTIRNNIATLFGNQVTDESNITNLQNRLTTDETNITNVTNRVSSAETNITNVTNRVSSAETNITNVTNRVSTAETTIANNETRFISNIIKLANIPNNATIGLPLLSGSVAPGYGQVGDVGISAVSFGKVTGKPIYYPTDTANLVVDSVVAFSSNIPTVNNATINSHVTNKSYVDTAIAAVQAVVNTISSYFSGGRLLLSAFTGGTSGLPLVGNGSSDSSYGQIGNAAISSIDYGKITTGKPAFFPADTTNLTIDSIVNFGTFLPTSTTNATTTNQLVNYQTLNSVVTNAISSNNSVGPLVYGEVTPPVGLNSGLVAMFSSWNKLYFIQSGGISVNSWLPTLGAVTPFFTTSGSDSYRPIIAANGTSGLSSQYVLAFQGSASTSTGGGLLNTSLLSQVGTGTSNLQSFHIFIAFQPQNSPNSAGQQCLLSSDGGYGRTLQLYDTRNGSTTASGTTYFPTVCVGSSNGYYKRLVSPTTGNPIVIVASNWYLAEYQSIPSANNANYVTNVWWDGIQVANSISCANQDGSGRWTIGCNSNFSGTNAGSSTIVDSAKISVAEVLFYNRGLSPGEANTVRQYLKTKLALPFSYTG